MIKAIVLDDGHHDSGDEIESFYDGRIEVMLTEKETF